MRTISLVLVLFITACANNQNATSKMHGPVNTDGIYYTKMIENEATGDKYRYFLRFYDDGTVISISSSGSAEEIANWFEKGHEQVAEGEWEPGSEELKFSTSSRHGDVTYEGEATDDELNLHISNNNNDNEQDVVFRYYPLEED